MKVKLLVFILLVFGFTIVKSQSLIDTIQLNEVTIIGKRNIEEVGLKITRPDSLARVNTLATSLSELISDYTPVFIKSYGRGATATASFRGTAATHTQVIWNGMNVNSPMRGIADLSLVPVFFIDDVYLLHGGSSLSESSGALGGSIQLNSQVDWNTKLELNGVFEMASLQTRKLFLKINIGDTKLKSNTRLFYEGSENNFPFYNYGVIPHRNDTLKNADYWKAGVLQEFYYRLQSDNIMSLRFWVQKSDRNLPQLMSYEGSEREEYQKDDQLRIQYDFKKYSNKINYHYFTGFTVTRLNYYRATPEFNFIIEDSKSRENSFQNQIKVYGEFSERSYATASIGVNYFQVQTHNAANDEGYKKDRFESSFLVDWHIKFSELFAAFVLMRSETYDKQVVPFIPAAGFEWQITKKIPLLIKSNIARNYHKPTLNDLYWLPGGNPDLLAEDGYSADLSLSIEKEDSRFSINSEITGFASLTDNWIMWQPSQNGAYYWEAGNIKQVFSRGLEFQFSIIKNWQNFSFRSGGNYSFTRTTNENDVRSVDESRGKQLIYIPKHKVNVFWTASIKNFTLKYDLGYIGKRYTNSANNDIWFERVLSSYWLNKISVDKMFETETCRLNFKFVIDNLFNEEYQNILWRPVPGRIYTFSISLNYKK